MSLMRLGSLIARSACNNISRGFMSSGSIRALQTHKVSTPKSNEEDDEAEYSEPIQYSTSPAASWSAEHSLQGDNTEVPWFQPYIVATSISVFMIYFFILRESNDIDEILSMDLNDHVKDIGTGMAVTPTTNDRYVEIMK